MKKGLLIFIGLSVFFYVTVYLLPNLSDSECIWDKKFREIELNGIIDKKYIDSSQHSYPMIEIRQFDADTSTFVNLIGDTAGSYYNMILGDTIYKLKGENWIKLKRRGHVIKLIVDFGCRSLH